MKRVLLIAYHYPPEGSSSGVLRTLKFSKYLARYGWEPHVLTLRESAYQVLDPGLMKQIPATAKVHRTRGFDTARRLSVRGRYLTLFTIPDRYVSWLPFAVWAGRGIIRREGIQALYSTSPVPTAHLIGAALKAATRVPWVADFRDPWIEEGIYPRPGSLRYHLEKRLEGAVLRRADRITVTTPELGAELRGRYPGLPGEKFRAIYNGFDEEDFAHVPKAEQADHMEIVHAGLLTPDFRDPFPLLRELSSLISEGEIPRASVRVAFLGGGGWAASDEFRRGVLDLGLGEVVRVEGRVTHEESLRRQARAGALLLLQASEDTRHLIPAKAFEYLRLGRPILALTLPGATARVLERMEQCHVLTPADTPGQRRALLDVYRRWRAGGDGAPEGTRPGLHAFERSHLTAELAALLDELAPAPGTPAIPRVRHA